MAVSEQRKAILGGLVALSGSLAAGLVDDALTLGEAAVAVAAGIAAYAAVYGIRNGPPPGAPADDVVDQAGPRRAAGE